MRYWQLYWRLSEIAHLPRGVPRYQRPVFNIHIVFRATAANGHMLTQISIKLKAKVAELVVEEAEEEEYLDVEFF